MSVFSLIPNSARFLLRFHLPMGIASVSSIPSEAFGARGRLEPLFLIFSTSFYISLASIPWFLPVIISSDSASFKSLDLISLTFEQSSLSWTVSSSNYSRVISPWSFTKVLGQKSGRYGLLSFVTGVTGKLDAMRRSVLNWYVLMQLRLLWLKLITLVHDSGIQGLPIMLFLLSVALISSPEPCSLMLDKCSGSTSSTHSIIDFDAILFEI